VKLLAVGGDVPGVVAIGPTATGVFAFGQHAHGVFAFGQVATGVVAFGQLATGVVAVGQLARGCVAVGQLALGVAAVGQVAIGVGWSAGLGLGGTSGPGLVYGIFGRVRLRQLGEHLYELRARFRRARGRMRGIPQDAVPSSFVQDAVPSFIGGRGPSRVPPAVQATLRSLGLVAIAVLWWFVAGQAVIDAV
jgi:hypothetical protein